MPVETNAARPTRLRDNRDFRLWWGGTVLSAIGDEVTAIALPLLVLLMTSSPLHAGLVGSVEAIPPLLLALPAGALVDRISRRGLMIGSSVLSMVSITSIPIAYLLDSLTLPQLYVVAVVNSAAATVYRIANTAALPRIVGQHKLGAAAGQSEMIWGIATIIAPPLAGLMFEVTGPSSPFMIDAISFLAIALCILGIRAKLGPDRRRSDEPMAWRAELTGGGKIAMSLPLLRSLTILTSIGDFLFAGIGLLLIVLVKNNGAAGIEIGTVFTFAAVAGIVGSLLAPKLEDKLGLLPTVIGKHWITAALFPLLLLDLPGWGTALVWGVICLQIAVLNVIQMKYLMGIVPNEHLGKVEGFLTFISKTTLPLGYALTGLLLEAFGVPGTLLVYEVVLVLLAIYATLTPELRPGARQPARLRLRRRPAPGPTHTGDVHRRQPNGR
ncbi:MFS transporter [Crossiella cryophila]|uniref:MFS family permease n=1 Tax=Crossiella cryophila TaxID=43355 RepID=A0A7W7CCA7_9PSEU|nr:MFS transporter [Crossiella cryophila]MBB4678522.1 MFS family permease [Crossiella cryophila]